ncbi:serine/threonine-protein kinase [Nonomuraea fuscirosea]|uniref:serine/threonine-protein kinase n=1 Tax=Nonomuraea fuscirosea TaxID=1291556 RepID=UPI0034232F20
MSVSRCEGWLLAGRYRLQAELGRGGMGRVWRGHDEILDRPVAIKEVTLDERPPSEREMLLSRTMTEARLAARLSHPNIATVYDVVEADERPWIVLQLVPAPTLASVLAKRGPLPPVVVARIGLQVLDALQAAHAAGVVHRDVKPANILLDAGESHAVLTDFGLATSVERPVDLTGVGIVVGTPAFIAPERARGGPPTPQTDLWSLGVTLYTAVEGRCPFGQSGVLATISAVLTAEPAPFERAGPLAPLLTNLLAKDPEQRISTRAARRQLEQVCAPPTDYLPRTGDVAPAAAPSAVPAAGPAAVPSPSAESDSIPVVVPLAGFDSTPPATPGSLLAATPAAGAPDPPSPPGRGRRAQIRHVVVAAALTVGVLTVSFWPEASPDPPPAAPQPTDRLQAALTTPTPSPTATTATTPAATPTTSQPSRPSAEPTAAVTSPEASQDQQVPTQRRSTTTAGRATSSADSWVPPGQAKKAATSRDHVPPGHSAGHPGKGKGRR